MTLRKKTTTRKPGTTGSKAVGVRTRLDAGVRSKMIVDAAFKVIAKDGFEGLRTRDIAKIAGINSATLHHHFPTKENLIAAVADHLKNRFRAEDTPAAEGESAVDALQRELQDAIFYYTHRPEMLAVYREFVGRAPRDPVIRKLVQQLNRGWHAKVLETLRRGQSDGSFRADLDLKAAASIILSTVWGLLAHIFPSREDFAAGFHELISWLVAERNGKGPTKAQRAKSLKAGRAFRRENS